MRKMLSLAVLLALCLPASAQSVVDARSCRSLKDVEKQAQALRKEILESKSEIKVPGTVYYVSNSGDDRHDGKSPRKAVKTLDKVNSLELQSGDAVLFKRGDLWRGQIRTQVGVTYSAYGKGPKPCLYGSPFDAAMTGEWIKTDVRDVYVFSIPLEKDPGTLVFDNGAGGCAFKVMKRIYPDGTTFHVETGEPFEGYRDLHRDLDFFFDRHFGLLYLKSDRGNPARRFDSIEILNGNHGILAVDGVTIDNLCIKYVGAHGISAGTCKDLTVTNCEIGWIGGTIQFDNPRQPDVPVNPTRYGNGVEIWGGCDNYNVSHNYIYQVYDAGITHQFKGGDVAISQNNITYKSNLVEKCVYAIEYFLEEAEDGTEDRSMHNVLIEGNILRLSGYGWGSQRPDKSTPALIKSWSHTNKASDFRIVGNIFDRGRPNLLNVLAKDSGWLPEWEGNIFFQTDGVSIGTPVPEDAQVNFVKE